MEQWQKELINSNLPALLDTMQCNTTLMSMLSANSLITKDEEHELVSCLISNKNLICDSEVTACILIAEH